MQIRLGRKGGKRGKKTHFLFSSSLRFTFLLETPSPKTTGRDPHRRQGGRRRRGRSRRGRCASFFLSAFSLSLFLKLFEKREGDADETKKTHPPLSPFPSLKKKLPQLEQEAQMIAEAAEGAADEVHSAEQAAEMESVADQEVRGIFCFFSFFSSFSSCLRPLLSHAPSLHLPPSLSLSLCHSPRRLPRTPRRPRPRRSRTSSLRCAVDHSLFFFFFSRRR